FLSLCFLLLFFLPLPVPFLSPLLPIISHFFSFVYTGIAVRAGYGKLLSQKDSCFEEYYAQCQKYGIPTRAYWYSYAKSVSEIRTETEVFLQVIKGKQFEYPVYLDFEEFSQFALGKAKCSEMAKAFLEIVEKAGYFTGLYSSKSHLETYFTEDILNRYTVWVAHYGVSQTSYKYPYDVWQYSEKGTVSGLTGNVDMNFCYRDDFPTAIKELGLNGFQKAETVPAEKKSVQEIAEEVLADKWGTGAERKERLTSAGYDYAEVQNAVNALLASADKSQLTDAPAVSLMNFGNALEALKKGDRVARTGWNGTNQYIQLATCISYKTTDGAIINAEHDAIGNKAIAFVGTSGIQLGWLASQADMLAEDWKIVD
ncbi:MAG: DUF2829 domain-containing protein, partial [Oscillospiraceae bacterium]|nr:DUF2829 domain-containing protein [Oscillospiraceae bacterium]